MKREIALGVIQHNEALNESYYKLEVQLPKPWHNVEPGQFVQISAQDAGVFLRRPISICDYQSSERLITFLVQKVGRGSRFWSNLPKGSTLNLVGPLGNGFDYDPSLSGRHPLLIGGGVGIAPLFYLGKKMQANGIKPFFLLGARTKSLLVMRSQFEEVGTLFSTTEDGSYGEKGRVTDHSICLRDNFTAVYSCGPLPMMQGVARWAKEKGIPCQVSLENKMACGIGACLCCPEATTTGHKCTCSDGPVFSTEKLLWN